MTASYDTTSALAGEAAAKALLAGIVTAPPDRLFVEVLHLMQLDDQERLRSYLRVVQKNLEGRR